MAGDTQYCATSRFHIHSTVLALLTFIGLILFPVALTAQQTVQAISEVDVVVGQYAPCPAGYTKIDKDLNAGAGGNYIWLCYKKGLGAPITGLYVADAQLPGRENPPKERGYMRIDVDLNRGAGGDTDDIFLWFTKDPNCSVISEIYVGSVCTSCSVTCPEGFTKDPVDLNRNAGGNTINLCYKTQ